MTSLDISKNVIYYIVFIISFITYGCYADANGQTLKVVIVEPDNNEIGYVVIQDKNKANNMDSIYKMLSYKFSLNDKIIMLFHQNVPISSITTMNSLASKVGYARENIKQYTFDKKREGMIELSLGNKFLHYTNKPNDLNKLFK